MPTTPEQVRRALQLVTGAGVHEIRAVVQATPPAAQRTALLAVTPLVVSSYTEGSAALALDWYDELRDAAAVAKAFAPSIVAPVREAFLGNAVAWATETSDETLTRLEPIVQREIAAGFWATMTDNAKDDPDAVGWQRFARGDEACPFCRMLADKGAVYRRDTARFAAHRSCHCVAAPAFKGHHGPEAGVMQYVASSKRRSKAAKAMLRDYLKEHYGA